MLIVDNYIYSYALNLENGICIKPYYEGKEDNELEYLAESLQIKRGDMREIVGFDLGLKSFYKYLGYAGI